jgi:hypothetical protein
VTRIAILSVAALAVLADGCGSELRSPRADVPRTLASSRRLHYVVLPVVPVPGEQGTAVAPAMTAELRRWVEADMARLGMDSDEDLAQAHDVEVRLALAVRRQGPQALGRGAMQVRADGRVLEVWSTAEHASPPEELPRQLARELVDELACSPRVAAHADALYGRRLRPLAETTGRRAFVADEAPMPPLEAAGGDPGYRTKLRCPETTPEAASRAR